MSKKILNHPDKEEIIKRLGEGESVRAVEKWLKKKYPANKKLWISTVSIQNFRKKNLMVVDDLKLKEIKTKGFLSILSALKLQDALIVTGQKDETIELSSRNIPNVKVLRSEGLNVYDILNYETLVLLESSGEIAGIAGIVGSIRAVKDIYEENFWHADVSLISNKLRSDFSEGKGYHKDPK